MKGGGGWGVVQFEWMFLNCALLSYIVITGLTVQAKLTVRPPGNLLVLEVCSALYRDSETMCTLGSGSHMKRRAS